MSHAGARHGLGDVVKQAEFVIWKELRVSRGAGAVDLKSGDEPEERGSTRPRRDDCHMKSLPTSTQVEDPPSLLAGRADSQLSTFKNNELDGSNGSIPPPELNMFHRDVMFCTFLFSGDLNLTNACAKSSFV